MWHLIEDTRNQLDKHVEKNEYWKAEGIKVVRSALPFGDYAKVPERVVDTKASIYEIAQNIDQDHARFRNECIKAKEHGCQLIILVENNDGINSVDDLETWMESTAHFKARHGQRRIMGKRLSKAMKTMSMRYGVIFEFCHPARAGQRVIELLEGERDDDCNANPCDTYNI